MSKWLTGAGIGGLAGLALGGLPGALIGAGLGGLSSYTTEAQNKANKKALNASNQYDYWLWQQSNEYNSPVQQMQRLAEAGLNPNLVYGSGSVTGNTSGVASSNGVAPLTAQDYAKNSLGNYQSLLTAKQMEAGIVNTQALTRQANNNARNIVAQTKLTDANATRVKNDNAFFEKYGYYPTHADAPAFSSYETGLVGDIISAMERGRENYERRTKNSA